MITADIDVLQRVHLLQCLKGKTFESIVREVQFFQFHLVNRYFLVVVLILATSTVLLFFFIFLAWLFFFTKDYRIKVFYYIAF